MRVNGHWVHDLDPVLIQFTETLAVRWYGLAYVTGFLVAYLLLLAYHRRQRSPLNGPALESVVFWMILGVMIGGRLGHFLLYEPGDFLRNPLIFFAIWEGGMASHGGFAGVFIAGFYLVRKLAISPWMLGDLVVSVTPPGLFFGRIANFINGELWGKTSDVPWAVIFPQSAPTGTPLEWIAARHPSQLYQAGLEGVLLFAYVQWRFWFRRPERASSRAGHLMGEFLIAYSIVRWVGELYREPDGILLGLSLGSFYSLFLFLAGAGILVFVRTRPLTSAKKA